MKRRAIISSALIFSASSLVTACTKNSKPKIKKSNKIYSTDIESSLIIFNGEILSIHFSREWAGYHGNAIRIRKFSTGEIIAEHPWPGAMGCSIIKDGLIHIFGNTNWQKTGNRIIHSTLAADFSPSKPTDAIKPTTNQPQPYKFYNTSVTADKNGYCMAVETDQGIYFTRSNDLTSWETYGSRFLPGKYSGCPQITYIDNTHYITYLSSENKRFVTKAAKSNDNCQSFQYGKTLLSPSAEEGTNNSDVKMIEWNNKVHGLYIDGDQSTWWHLKTFTYDGTMKQLFSELT